MAFEGGAAAVASTATTNECRTFRRSSRAWMMSDFWVKKGHENDTTEAGKKIDNSAAIAAENLIIVT
jgi:hypothetical protein